MVVRSSLVTRHYWTSGPETKTAL